MQTGFSLLDMATYAASASPSPTPTPAEDASGWTPQVLIALCAVLVTLGVGVANLLVSLRTKPIDRTRLLTERFGRAAEQIGHDDPAVRLAGLYAMAALADEWEEQRQQCVDVLCGYMRLPPRLQPGEQPHTQEGEEQVRGTIAHILHHHLYMEGTPKEAKTPGGWSDLRFNFREATFTGDVWLNRATFAHGARFKDAKFTGDASFEWATLGDVWFDRATFTGNVSFDRATFTGKALFDGATFTGDVSFDGATFTDNVSFDGARTTTPIDLTDAGIADGATPRFTMPDGSSVAELCVIPASWDGDESSG